MKQLKTRKQKLKFLRQVLMGTRSVYDIMPPRNYIFVLTNEDGIYYSTELNPPIFTPDPIDGKIERYTLKDMETLRMKGHNYLPIKFSVRPPFPDVDENGKLVKKPPPIA